MRKSYVLLTTVALFAASPAAARNGDWYVGGDFGGMIVEDVHFDYQSTSGPTGDLRLNHNYGFDGGLFVGYDLGMFRLEAEGSYKTANIKSIENSLPIISSEGILPPDRYPHGGGRTSALSFMVNGMLDFGDDDGLSGFVGGGVGIARVNYTIFAPSRTAALSSTTAIRGLPGRSSRVSVRRSATTSTSRSSTASSTRTTSAPSTSAGTIWTAPGFVRTACSAA